MSVSTEVQRTLVKSPPELWAELSDPEALSRHLGELGEIRVTCVEPETKVEWETDGASGVVHLKQSGWGTKVTLSLTREAPAPDEQSEAEQTPEPAPEQFAEPAPEQVAQPAPEQVAELEPIAEPTATEPKPVAEATETEPEPQLGFFARLFRRRRARLVEVEPEPEPFQLAAPEPIYLPQPAEPAADLAAELKAMEAQMAEQTTELLTAVLDRLGAAHHRPFSRG